MQKKTQAGLLAAAGAAAAATAGYYFYASKNAGKNRRVAAKWAKDLKKDVISRAARMDKIGRKTIYEAIDDAARAYAGAREVSTEEIIRAGKELKNNWQSLMKELPKPRKTTSRPRSTAKSKKR